MSALTVVSVELGEHDVALAGVSSVWFTSAFEVAVGNTISEALERFHDDLADALDSHPDGTPMNGGDAERFRTSIMTIMYRMSVAAEWAERVERLRRAQAKADHA